MRKPIAFINAEAVDGQVELSWYASTPMFEGDPGDEFSSFRVYRKEEGEFTFGQDYEEFFLGVDGADAELLFEGELTPANGRKYTYVDRAAAVGCTYSYFVQTKTSTRIGPAPVKVRDTRVWWPYDYQVGRLQGLADGSSGRAKLYWCGTTGAGRRIPCVEVGSGVKTLGLVGLIHAGEAGPELIIPALKSLLANHPDLLRKVRVVAVPAVNIDAREQLVRGIPWYLRTTPPGVDVNRNFPADWHEIEYGYGLDSSDPHSVTYRGRHPASAPETQAVISVFTDTRPDVVLSCHCLAGICGLPAIAPRKAAEDQDYAHECRHIIQLYAEGLYPEKEFADNWLHFGCSAGSLPTWLYDLGRIPAFDLEGCQTVTEERSRTDLTDLPAIKEYQQRHARAIENLIRGYLAP